MKLRRPQRLAAEPKEGMLERKTSKRQRLVQFFRSRKRKPSAQQDEVAKRDITATIASPASVQSQGQSTVAPGKALKPANNPTERLATTNEHFSQLPTPPPEPFEKDKGKEKEKEKEVEVLSEAQLQLLFAGAPHFSVVSEGRRSVPTVTYPYGNVTAAIGQSDSISFDEPAFRAATLHKFTTKKHDDDITRSYSGYNPGIVELPSMLSAQGTEPGSIGFSYFLELSQADSLVTDLDDSQSSKHFLQASRNKELMQSSPERVGIRAVDMSLVYDRLIEVQDLYETFQDSPEPMTILNNQSAGELYANLFSKFLTPPGHDGSEDDPTGLRIQISTLCRILSLRGIWYDFSLVEWRIRLGQLIWSDPEPVPEHESHPLWTEREILLLQITLACELLLRLDAVSIIDAQQLKEPLDIKPVDVQEFFSRKTAKLDWDLILARRFLDNILAIRNDDQDPGSQIAKSRGLLSIIGMGQNVETLKSDIILLPQHQSCQLKGLLKFAETVQWPNAEVLLQDLLGKLGAGEKKSPLDQPSSPSGLLFDPVTPSSISVYGTPLQTPRPTSHLLDGYFGHVGKPTLSRDNSHSLRIPLSSTLSSLPDQSPLAMMSIGGWLSRSYLTGLVLPGEPISHFLISTLLENDTEAIARLGDSANLYGGFSYAGRTWWSKNSIVGRVFACIEGAAECMGWISFPKIPAGMEDGWHSIHSDQLPLEDRLTRSAKEDVVLQDAASIPKHITDGVKPEDLVLPSDADLPPSSSIAFIQWDLTPLNPDLMDSDDLSDPPNETDIHIPSVTFLSGPNTHILTLAYDVQFISSWPCTSPNASPTSTLPHLLKRSNTATISRASSKRSASIRITRRNSHGFEPLLSHPPDSTDIAPKPMPPIEAEEELDVPVKPAQPVHVHPLHSSYRYKIVPVTHVLRPDFHHPNDSHARQHAALSSSQISEQQDRKSPDDARDIVLVLDARASTDLQLLARAWCAEKGYQAVVGRTSRTCLACCIREARGLGIHVIIRV